jgi:DNA-binding GntR family transcriptional regulator
MQGASDPHGVNLADIVETTRATTPQDQIHARLHDMLAGGVVPPGAKLNEPELCARLQTSRTALREAIKRLTVSGLVELTPDRGAIAARLTAREVADTFEVLAALEGLAGELAATGASEDSRNTIGRLHESLLAAYVRRDLAEYYRFNSEVHAAIIAAAGNPVLTRTYRSVNARVRLLRYRIVPGDAAWHSAMDDHCRMVVALGARDGAGLKSIMTRHLQARCDRILAILDEADGRREAGV